MLSSLHFKFNLRAKFISCRPSIRRGRHERSCSSSRGGNLRGSSQITCASNLFTVLMNSNALDVRAGLRMCVWCLSVCASVCAGACVYPVHVHVHPSDTCKKRKHVTCLVPLLLPPVSSHVVGPRRRQAAAISCC